MTEEKPKKAHEILIIPENCKGCGICVDFCPAHVLKLHKGKVTIAALESCIGCKLCDLRCPDFAILVDNPNADRMLKNKSRKIEEQNNED